ncbi:MAG TPA: (2Fe-2S)-binding protein [Acetobacteraceae bacterium]|nr:(2Fe-2S)-binding protein [Acetobacteraceae bacterium]
MLARPDTDSLTIYLDGEPLGARAGDSVAAAFLAHGIHTMRRTPVSGAPRGPYCMMGACFECLAVVDGEPGVRTCLAPVRDGMRIERQDGAHSLPHPP